MGSRLRDTVRYLFELFCEVSPGDHVREPYIIRKYPESYKNEEELKNVPKFAFPCQLENSFVQHYSFVLTSVDSKYTFCFCRYDPKANTALVLLSHLPWHDQFYKLLNCIANLINGPEKGELTSLLEACRIRPPMPGHTLKVTYNAGQSVFSCQSPDNKLPSIPENCNLTEYFSAMDTKCMAGLWAALLHERRVAIVASKPSRLSACVQAANATLFPMSWQHIFIPILPKHLVDYLLAPMPFLIGVPRSVMETVRMSEIGDVVILDVDANELRTPFNDLESLPPDMVASLKKALSDKNALGDAVSRAFLRALVCLIGGYRDAIRIEKGQLITFNPEAFVRTRKNMQQFLTKILQSQIFQQFIDERLDLLNSGRGFNDEFEVECNFYAEKLGTGSGQRLKQQYRDWAKTVKKEGGAFFKTIKDKVRQGGKNVKSAVKGLKNKMPKTGSRPSSINTTDDSRFSCGSATPVSSNSSDSSPAREGPPREPPPALPLDLLTEMEFLFKNTQRRDSFPNSSLNSEISLPDKAKTLSPCLPPRLPERPKPPLRYPIISTRKLIDITDAPAPPPRASPAPTNNMHFVSNITKNDADAASNFHTSTICFSEGNDKAKLKLTLSTNQRKLPQLNAPAPVNGSALKLSAPPVDGRQQESRLARPGLGILRPPPLALSKGILQESCGSDSDLIKLDDSPTNLEDFDPLKRRNKEKVEPIKSTTDSALLHEYGLDFSQFGLLELPAGSSARPDTPSSVPKGWTTFN
ncbi:DENN domain-containing protein 1A-like isoform X2 [Pectinophora gossypiella]|uniref:DENN domain-containing protein 1A-like isoform X2 n=1 Tax=Pectinophora gossypiella TaxID=13191 RepID=UPI00214DFCDE|nr:DENN domain-containing protein 1A-like isoform X2 [Pectinophora gossypiella]